MTMQATVLIEGAATGEVLRLDAPISFWGGVDPDTAQVVLASHPQCGQCIAGKLLVIPTMIGSSSSSSVLLELIHKKRAPLGLILGSRDAILPISGIVARQMGWACPPILVLEAPMFQTGDRISIEPDGHIFTKSAS